MWRGCPRPREVRMNSDDCHNPRGDSRPRLSSRALLGGLLITAGRRASLGLDGSETRPHTGNLDPRQLVQIFHVRAHSAVHTLHVRVRRLDHVVLIRRVSTTAVAHSKVTGGKA
jgi:hypothetical protein